MGAQESGETLQPSGFWKNIPFKVQTASWKFGASQILLPCFHTIINGQFQNTTGLLASKVSTLSDTPRYCIKNRGLRPTLPTSCNVCSAERGWPQSTMIRWMSHMWVYACCFWHVNLIPGITELYWEMSLGSGKRVFSQSKASYCVPLNQRFD